jgi:hypothetical protein
MSGNRQRIVLDPAYATALGEALYCFAICEWNAVYCIQKKQPNYVIDAFKPTHSTMAGTVADKLRSVAAKISDPIEKATWTDAAEHFFDLVKNERNRLIHAKPGSNIDQEQRLFYFGFEWTIDRVKDVADRFAECGLRLNTLCHQP